MFNCFKKSYTEDEKKIAEIVSSKADCTTEDALTAMRKANRKYGISFEDFSKYDLYEVPFKEQGDVYSKLVKKEKRALKRQLNKNSAILVEKFAISKETADELLLKAFQDYGIKFSDYVRYDFYNIPDSEKAQQYANILEKREIAKRIKENRINIIVNQTSMSREDAEMALKEAKNDRGITNKVYVNLELYKYSIEQQNEIYAEYKKKCERKKQKAALKKKRVELIVNDSSLTYEEALKAMNFAKSELGIPNKDFVKYKIYNFSDDKKEYEYKKIINNIEALKEVKERRIGLIMNETDMTYEEASNIMDIAKKKYGIKNKYFISLQLYKHSEDEFENIYNDFKKQQAEEKHQEIEFYLDKIMSATGWQYDDAVLKVKEAQSRTHCTTKEFFIYHFYEMTQEEQESVFLSYDSKRLIKNYDVDKKLVNIFCNKQLTNSTFSDCITRQWCVNTRVTLEEFKEIFADSTRIIYKPISGHKGFGVEDYRISKDNIESVYNELSAMPEGVVEEYVKQHSEISKISPSSVNTIRVVTLSSNVHPVTVDGKYFDIAYTAMRIGSGKSIVDNFHSGGMVAVIDKHSGEIITNAADEYGNIFIEHPLTGIKIKGIKIPYFDEIIDMVTKAVTNRKIEGYIGWDIAVSETGPELIEVNAMPGVVLLSTPYAVDKKGFKPMMEKYLEMVD